MGGSPNHLAAMPKLYRRTHTPDSVSLHPGYGVGWERGCIALGYFEGKMPSLPGFWRTFHITVHCTRVREQKFVAAIVFGSHGRIVGRNGQNCLPCTVH
ncbi:hypothetical protein Cenrod_1242 [Candidatus Symbiobacter mobilis CR]|uniref:Uncharacterized protein n=1 Tax=Candidatus Symbiobacter mobilis CR TaxID=946483 RepID=U5NAZ9_9BURK|nr:hypothetical protein Cenrod_1242 [Candidatus Symbiobacter mobilis CR]